MKKEIKITIAVVGIAIVFLVVNPIGRIKEYNGKKAEITLEDPLVAFEKSGSQQSSTVIPTVEITPIPQEYVEAGIIEVIEEDSETGAVLGRDETGKNVIVLDEALEIAEKEKEVTEEVTEPAEYDYDTLLKKSTWTSDETQFMISIILGETEEEIEKIEESSNTTEVATDTKPATTDKDKKATADTNKDKKTADTSKDKKDTTEKKDNFVVDAETEALFKEMGWSLEEYKERGRGGYDIPEDAVWTIINPDKNYNGTFDGF